MTSRSIKSPCLLSFFFSLALLSRMSLPATTAVICCHEAERQALLELKLRLDDPSNRLSSWVGENCCAWQGVECNNITARVIKLDLRNEFSITQDYRLSYFERKKFILRGELNTPSLLSLEQLTHLDLSGNDFSGHTIPRFLGSFQRLTYLNLSNVGFTGKVPEDLGNLSTLQHLDLSTDFYFSYYDYDDESSGNLYLENPGWMARLTSLRHLNMGYVSFPSTSNWFQVLNALPRIQHIELAWCDIIWPLPHSPPHLNFTSLLTLNLEGNYINGTAPAWLYNLTSLEYLNFRWNNIYWSSMHGSISKLTSLRALDLSGNSISNNFLLSLSNLCNLQILILDGLSIKDDELSNLNMVFSGCLEHNLKELHLSFNQFSGLLGWLGNFKNLKYIDLSNNLLRGSLPVSLGSLTSLQYLDLSYNNLNGDIGDSIGQLKNLVHLDLSYNSFNLSLMHLANLSSLKQLDISNNYLLINDTNDWMASFQLQILYMDSCEIVPMPHFAKWLQTQTTLSLLSLRRGRIQDTISNWFPSSLKYLHHTNNQIGGEFMHVFPNLKVLALSYNLLSGHLPLQMANMMPSLEYLDLSNNKFTGEIPQTFTKLLHLDLSNNFFSGHLALQMGNMMPSLRNLYLYNNNLSGHLPLEMANMMPSLEYLDLSNNKFTGDIPQNFTKLQHLDLSNNLFSGYLPLQMGNMMPSLRNLHLYNNNLSGHLPLEMANMMPSLEYLDLSNNKFTGDIPQNFTKLQHLDLSNNLFSGYLPLQMGNMMPSLQNLYLYDNNLSGHLPLQMANMMPSLKELSLSNNHFTGKLSQNFTKLQYLDLSNNFFSGHHHLQMANMMPSLECLVLHNNLFIGEVPQNFTKLQYLFLSNNMFSGHLNPTINDTLSNLIYFDLSMNYLSGSIPYSLCQMNPLLELRLSENNFSRELPSCWNSSLEIFDITHNQLYGEIPDSLCNMRSIRALHLSHNHLSGRIPLCLQNCRNLIVLNAGHNNFIGNIATWSLNNFSYLEALSLRSNFFSGNIPELSQLASLQILDLSNNYLTGSIPQSFSNFTTMKSSPKNVHGDCNATGGISLLLFTKGKEHEYGCIVALVIVVDLSDNNLSGYIPKELGNLHGLQSLNLSGNNLIGEIPSNINGMQNLEVLDLSRNNLSGKIPSTLADLYFLSTLNLSYNNLSGSIPIGRQLQTFDNSTYIGNPNLCGPPLTKNCTYDKEKKGIEEGNKDDNRRKETIWLITSTTLGFILGFWGFWATLLWHKRWRIFYFSAIDNAFNKFYVEMLLQVRRKFF